VQSQSLFKKNAVLARDLCIKDLEKCMDEVVKHKVRSRLY